MILTKRGQREPGKTAQMLSNAKNSFIFIPGKTVFSIGTGGTSAQVL